MVGSRLSPPTRWVDVINYTAFQFFNFLFFFKLYFKYSYASGQASLLVSFMLTVYIQNHCIVVVYIHLWTSTDIWWITSFISRKIVTLRLNECELYVWSFYDERMMLYPMRIKYFKGMIFMQYIVPNWDFEIVMLLLWVERSVEFSKLVSNEFYNISFKVLETISLGEFVHDISRTL